MNPLIPNPCSVPDCENGSHSRGWCHKHYYRWRKTGDPLVNSRNANASARDSSGRKRCPSCEEWKNESEFNRRSATVDLLDGQCRQCVNRKQRGWDSVREGRSSPGEFRLCVYCGSSISSEKARKYCSYSCGKKVSSLRYRARRSEAFVENVFLVDVVSRDGIACGICFAPVDLGLSYPEPLSSSIDHVIPLARGGEHSLANAQLAHLACNAQKGTRIMGAKPPDSKSGVCEFEPRPGYHLCDVYSRVYT